MLCTYCDGPLWENGRCLDCSLICEACAGPAVLTETEDRAPLCMRCFIASDPLRAATDKAGRKRRKADRPRDGWLLVDINAEKVHLWKRVAGDRTEMVAGRAQTPFGWAYWVREKGKVTHQGAALGRLGEAMRIAEASGNDGMGIL